jgi:hypothetical protein
MAHAQQMLHTRPPLHLVTTEILALVPTWHTALYSGVLKVKCMQSAGDSLLHVGVRCEPIPKLVLVKGFKETDIAGPVTAYGTTADR